MNKTNLHLITILLHPPGIEKNPSSHSEHSRPMNPTLQLHSPVAWLKNYQENVKIKKF